MDYKVFYRKYRPSSFDELVGQDNIKEILVNSIKTGRIAHAYIFTGPRGTGKTSTAKIFAKTLNCTSIKDGISCNKCDSCLNYNESADIIEIDAASNNGVEEIRALRDSVKIAPYSSKYKVYIIDEVHMLSNSAWNAFLKTLEEPPSHVIFILATTEINKIPETVMSRCQRFDFSKISNQKMKDHLSNICKIEKVDINDDALDELIKLSNGCLRDALSFLDKVSKSNCKIDVNVIQNNFVTLSKKSLEKLFNQIRKGNKTEINTILDYYSSSGLTPLNFINEFVDYLLNKLLNESLDVKEMESIKDLIYKLNKITSNSNTIVNPFTLIKVELITLNYFPGNNYVDISQNIIDNSKEEFKNNELLDKETNANVNEVDNISVIKENDIGLQNSVKLDVSKIKEIRINNSFVDVSKEYKIGFIKMWNAFIENMNIVENYNLLGYVENTSVEVVSKTNVLFSFKTASEAILFNENLNNLENSFNEFSNTNYKFFALSQDEWSNAKKDFINNKSKKYVYMEENVIESSNDNVKNFGIAENIFGDDIIEIR